MLVSNYLTKICSCDFTPCVLRNFTLHINNFDFMAPSKTRDFKKLIRDILKIKNGCSLSEIFCFLKNNTNDNLKPIDVVMYLNNCIQRNTMKRLTDGRYVSCPKRKIVKEENCEASKCEDLLPSSKKVQKDLVQEPPKEPSKYVEHGQTSEVSSKTEMTLHKYFQNFYPDKVKLEDIKGPIEIKSQGKTILNKRWNAESLSQGKTILNKRWNAESLLYFEPNFMLDHEADDYLIRLYEAIHFDARNIVIHGVEYPQPRLVAWFGPFEYKYSGTTLKPAEMPDVILELKDRVEQVLNSNNMEESFNSVLINHFRDGKDCVAWHSDNELMLGISPTIASVSFGGTRKFEIRPKIGDYDGHSPSDNPTRYFVHLTHGSLIIMTGAMQDDWQHRVPKKDDEHMTSINLTFHTVYPLDVKNETTALKIDEKDGQDTDGTENIIE